MPKCGTSTLQNVCASQRKILDEHGVLYPDFSKFHESYRNLRYRSTGNGNPFVYLIRNKSDPEAAPDLNASDVLTHFQEQLRGGNYHTVIISHEDFCSLPAQVLLDLGHQLGASPEMIRFFLHIRPHDQWLASDYQQHVKQLRIHHSLSTHIGNRLKVAEFSKICDRFARTIGPERMHVRLLDRSLIRTNIVHDFFTVLGNDIPALKNIPMPASNEGLDLSFLEILRVANARGLPKQQFHLLMNFYAKFHARSAGAPSGRVVLDADQAELVHAFYEADRGGLRAYLSAEEIDVLERSAPQDSSETIDQKASDSLDFLLFALKGTG